MHRIDLNLDQLCEEITPEVSEGLTYRVSGRQPGVVGAIPLSLDSLKSLVRVGLDIAVQYAGPMIEAGVIASKDQIKSVLTSRVIDFVDGLIHDLQDAKLAGPG